jgi:hypothetical protein
MKAFWEVGIIEDTVCENNYLCGTKSIFRNVVEKKRKKECTDKERQNC